MYNQLRQSYQWNAMNRGNAVTTRINNILSSGESIKSSEFQDTINQIRNRIKCPIITQILEYEQAGRIVFVATDKVRVPVYMPFILMNTSGHNMVGIVFLNNCDYIREDTGVTLNGRKLKVSMESCYMALRMMELCDSPKLTAPNIIRPAVKIYSHLITEALSRRYNIKLDQTVFNSVIYTSSRFFVGTVMGYLPNENTMENFCLYNCINADLPQIRVIADQFEPKDYIDISTYLTKLASIPELVTRLGKLTVAGFTENCINMFNAPILLALEVFPYFLYNVLSVNETTYVNNYHALKNIVEDEGKKLYATLIASIC